MTAVVQPNPGVPNPRGRQGTGPSHSGTPTYQAPQKLTFAKFVSDNNQKFPMTFTVTKGFYGRQEDFKFAEGDQFTAHSLKQTTVVTIEFDNGQRENIPVDYPIPFAILFNPNNNITEAVKGYKYEKISELVQLPVLPPLLWSRKEYSGSSQDSSVSANELLIVKGVKSRLMGRQQLKVYSLTQRREKTLYTTCTGSFSTKPRDISLYLPDILKHMPDIFPCRAVMFNSETTQHPSNAISKSIRAGASVVTMLHSSINTSVVVSSVHGHSFPSTGTPYLDIPIDLNIMVRKETSVTPSNPVNDGIYEDTSLYDKVLPPGQERETTFTIGDNQQANSQFYTNVHFGQETPLRNTAGRALSVERAIETGHYQTPASAKERTSSDPIAIDSVYHPPDDAPPGNYVCMMKNAPPLSSGSNGSGGSLGSNPPRGPGSWERGSPSSRNDNNDNISSSPSYRPPLPPPNKIKRNLHHRSPGYSYVETNPARATQACDGNTVRTHAKNSSDSGIVLSSTQTDSATSMSSFGSSGSGGAVVERRGSCGQSSRSHAYPGSGDGRVERSMRSSSVSSQGYSYAKTTGLRGVVASQAQASAPSSSTTSSSSGQPLSPHHYNHLRSNSGPPVTPQLLPLSAQLEQQQQKAGGSQPLPGMQQDLPPPTATTRVDEDSDSLVVVQRQLSMPVMGSSQRKASLPITASSSDTGLDKALDIEKLDDFAGVLDDLAKITEELDEHSFFIEDSSSDSSPNMVEPSKPDSPLSTTSNTTAAAAPSNQASDGSELPPEVIEKNRSYLKAMDSYQILNLLEMMGLEQYTPIFRQEQINGDILSTCDDAILKEELKMSSRLHRMRLLRVIAGTYSVHEIMAGKDGYIFMTAAGKHH